MYKNAQYINNPATGEPASIQVEIDGQVMFVPMDPANKDYQAILEAVTAGELVIAPAAE